MLHRSARRTQLFALAALTGVCIVNAFPLAGQNSGTATVQAAPPPRIVPPPPSYRMPNGQKLVYIVEWHMLTAGTATMELSSEGNQEKLTANASTQGAVNFIYSVHSWFEARIDPKTFCSIYVFKHSDEGKRKKEVRIQFDSGRGKSILDEKNLKNGESHHQVDDAPACATDILSGFFYLASRPLLPNSDETFPVVDGGKPTMVRATVEDREEVKVPAGDFHAIRVRIDPISGKFQGKGQIWVWYRDDAAHTPVQMKAKLQWGTVMFKLQRIEK